jgi:hypothetical protein
VGVSVGVSVYQYLSPPPCLSLHLKTISNYHGMTYSNPPPPKTPSLPFCLCVCKFVCISMSFPPPLVTPLSNLFITLEVAVPNILDESLAGGVFYSAPKVTIDTSQRPRQVLLDLTVGLVGVSKQCTDVE